MFRPAYLCRPICSEKDAEVGEAEGEYESASRRLGEVEAKLATLKSQLTAKQAEMKGRNRPVCAHARADHLADLEKKLAVALGESGLTVKAALETAQEDLLHLKRYARNALFTAFADG